MQLLSSGSATSDAKDYLGGGGTFVVTADTWGGGTVKLQFSPDDGTTWLDIGGNATMTADGATNFAVGGCRLRANVATATGVNAWVLIGASR